MTYDQWYKLMLYVMLGSIFIGGGIWIVQMAVPAANNASVNNILWGSVAFFWAALSYRMGARHPPTNP